MSELLAKAKSLLPAIKELIKLGDDCNRARDIFEAKHPKPLMSSFSRERHEAYDNDEGLIRTEESLKKHLETLTFDDLAIVQSIMYIGRDERDVDEFEQNKREVEESGGYFDDDENGIYDSPHKKIFDYLKHIKKDTTNTKEILIHTLMEKSPLPEYLARGLKILKLR